VTGDWIVRFEPRSLDDIRAVGRNSPEDDRAFAAVARLSELNLSIYRTFAQPLVRALGNPAAAEFARTLNPLRLSYTMFADGNPWMSGVQQLAATAATDRKPAAAGNPFTALQTTVSDQIIASLDAYRALRDHWAEHVFFGFYGSPFVQALLGIRGDEMRPIPSVSPEEFASQQSRAGKYAAKLTTGGLDEGLIRAVLYVIATDQPLDQQCALALNVVRQRLLHLSLGEFKILLRDQFFVLQFEPERGLNAITTLVPQSDARKELLDQTRSIVGAAGTPSSAELGRLARLSQLLKTPIANAAPSAIAAAN
jgi:hypothetical protein